MTNITNLRRGLLRGSSALQALALLGAGAVVFVAPASAQTTDAQPIPGTNADPATSQSADSPAVLQAKEQSGPQEIVVTGSLFRRRTDSETPSPVTTLTSDDLAERGIQTVQQGIQTLAANNGPAITNSFSANGAFAAGASAVSLRGLTTSSTLVLFDGLRAAYYPLADDGTRNFVDLNTIPDEIVERVEVLKDGASSTYGADAVAGVVNIITKKQVTGLYANAEAGISERGDYANQRLSATYGYGDLSDNGWNAYVSAHYIHSDPLYNRQRGYPFNSDDLSGVCYGETCGPNNIANGEDQGHFTGLSTAPSVTLARPYDPTNTEALGRYQLLNPALGCQGLDPYTLSDEDYNDPNNASAPRTVCQLDVTNRYGIIEPENSRWGASGRVTVELGDTSEFYTEVNFEQSKVAYTGIQSIYRSNAPTGIDFAPYSTTTIALPVYVCPERVNCDATNGTLNPNNPFAADGNVARIVGRLPTSREYNATTSRAFRIAAGLSGSFGDDWNYSVDATGMINKLKARYEGYVYIQHLLDVVADGSYNWMNPSENTQDVLDYLTPGFTNRSKSELYQVQANLAKDLFDLPGGPLQVGVGAALRYEAVNAPSANPDFNGPTERYFRINAFGSQGHRYVESGYFEINAPVLDEVEINGSGRYDHYSSGQDSFSPKIGVKFTPVKELALRGTYSRGFRIPSFAESGALPTTGYVTVAPSSLPDSFVNQHLNSLGEPNTYITSYSLGQTSVGTPGLKPEKSRNFTLGAIFEPIRNLSFTVDYYNIKKTNAITTANFQPAIDAYYAGEAIPEGYTVIADEPDINNPDAMPRIQFVQAGFVNANTIKTSGLDFGAHLDVPVKDGVTFSSTADATYIINLSTTFPDGSVEHYDGTLGNFNLTAGSGTPHWRGSWQNTVDFGTASLSATAYYTDGYNLSAEDQTGPGTAGDCGLSSGYTACDVDSFISVDLTGSIKVNDNFTFYVNVLNVFDSAPPLDPVTYGAYLYNPVQAEAGIIGRAFRAGFRANF